MCIALIGFYVHPAYPVIVAANRDEFHDRPSAPPRQLCETPWIMGGEDLRSGGTWLGLNAWGVVGLTNQPTQRPPPEVGRSRGLLVRDALSASSVREVASIYGSHQPDRYQAFNLFAIDLESVIVIYHRPDRLDVHHLSRGWHVLANTEIDDRNTPKVVRAFGLLEALPPECPSLDLRSRLRTILADHEKPEIIPDVPEWLPPQRRKDLSSICVHSGGYGTRSYSILMLDRDERPLYWHGEGPPCIGELNWIPLGRNGPI